MGSRKEIRDALEEFLKQPEDGEVNGILERYLSRVAVTGITLYPWSKLKPLITRKMNLVVEEFMKECPMESLALNKNVENTSVEDMKKRLNDSIELFNGIPFTIQRLCELLTDQNISKQYRRVDKFMRGIEKNLNVVTTVDPFGNRIVGDPKSASNGVLSAEDDCLLTPTSCTTVKTPPSWFSSLSSVVNSPDSYPNWKQSQDEQQQQEQRDAAISSSRERKKPRSEDDAVDKDCLPPPSKLFRPGDEFVDEAKQPETKDGSDSSVATNSTFTPLLTQLLNGSTPISSSEKEQSVVGSCDSTESSQPSGLLEILTGKLKDPETNLDASEGTPSVDVGAVGTTSQTDASEVFGAVKSEATQSTQYHVEITEHANKKDVSTASDKKTDEKIQQEPAEVKRTQEGELESSGVKCQQPSDDPDSLFSF
uniref:Protein phosphatase 4 regulatory subunit 2 n=1 Tax=Haemopis marmorata TaxID=38567 RepID=Q1PLL1_HAEMA|nr:protein phosphatase 4 regulatory subunit 2 [Haemopis marmorata]